MTRRLAALVATFIVACGSDPLPAPRLESSRASPRTLLVISIDGLRHDYLDDQTHAIPTLRRLRLEGAHAATVRGVWPTVTYPAHATLVTGALPARHGVLNNVVFDPFETNDGGWYWYASALRVPTLWDVAADAGIDVANETWPVTVGARIAHNLPQFWRARNVEDEPLLAALSTPGLYAEVARAAPPPAEHRGDRARADALLYLLRHERPGLALAYFTDLDTVQHEHGPMSAEAWAVLERMDALLAEILASASSPRLAVAIVSDHGFVPVDTEVRPNVALHDAGLLEVTPDGKKLHSYEAVTWKAGGTAAIIGRRELTARVRTIFDRLAADPANHIAAVLDGARVEKEGGFPGAIVVLQAAPGATFSERYEPPLVAPSHYRGSHGYAPDLPEMGTSFVLWGDGVRRGELGEVRMIDIGPTLATLLSLTLPAADGHPIEAALAR